MKSQIIYSHILPDSGRFPDESVLFYDSILAKNKDFKNWARAFRFKIALRSGESLKTIDSLKSVLNKISKMDVAKSTNLTFIGVGGGSMFEQQVELVCWPIIYSGLNSIGCKAAS